MSDGAAPPGATERGRAVSDVLVVIPTLNEAANIANVVDQLTAGDGDHVGFRIAIVDGGSVDGTQDIVRALMRDRSDVMLMDNPRRTQSAAMNLAVATLAAPGGIVVRCDAHADYPRGYVAGLVRSLDRARANSVVVPMDSVGRGCFGRAVAWVSDTKVGSGGSAHRGGRRSGWVDHGHHAAFRVDDFLANDGGYDLSFTHNEDAEFDCRLRARGGRIFLDTEQRIVYHPRETPAALWRQYRAYGRGRSRTIRRHPGSARLRQLILPAGILSILLSLPLAFAHPAFLLLPAIYAACLAWASVSVALSKRSLCGLLAGPAAAIMHVGWTVGFVGAMLTIRQPRWAVPAA